MEEWSVTPFLKSKGMEEWSLTICPPTDRRNGGMVGYSVTCGLLLACTPCGIILNVKEFYGAESCPQVALFYLETRKNFEGIS